MTTCYWKQAVHVATQYAPPQTPPVGALARRAPPSRRNVAVLSHDEYVPTRTAATALRVKAALNKAAWWPWPLFESRVTWAISVPILVFLDLSVLELRPMYATDRRQTDVRRQTKASLNAPPIRGGHNNLQWSAVITSRAGGRHNMPRPCKLTFDLLPLKVVSESRVTWATSVPILIFLGLSILDLGPMYATARQTSDAHHRLMPVP